MNGSILVNYTTWLYDVSSQRISPLWGHKYHILPTSPLPFVISLAILLLLFTLIFNLHGSKVAQGGFDQIVNSFSSIYQNKIFNKNTVIFFSDQTNQPYENIHLLWLAPFILTQGVFFLWSANAIAEGTTSTLSYLTVAKTNFPLFGKASVTPLFHSNLVRKGFKIGFILFIISEIMFFFGFFWAFFHSAVSPSIQIGAVWPPLGVEFITVKGFAIANTIILLTSGVTLTLAHYAFELIPQKKSRLYLENIPFTDSNISFEVKLEKDFKEMENFYLTTPYWAFPNEETLDRSGREIYGLSQRSLTRIDKMLTFTFQRTVAITFQNFINPLRAFMMRDLGLQDTETGIKLYITAMLNMTLILALVFMAFQGTEYFISAVNINTGVYGSTFYMITGLHGAHVFIGTCFLFYCWTAVDISRNIQFFYLFFYRILNCFWILATPNLEKIFTNFDYETESVVIENVNAVDHYGRFGIESFESAAWYWHFVDVVWIFVFGFVYVWSHLTVLNLQ